ncbi:DUF2157 domain-containing protein [Halosquirtibacter xylanolyticus]|uniref:DUF2157 domain-containing protein n=1 Tax=Halosquirtibacter xylanolyticus TaxID=3374599 RepID=UPI003747D078|nr:DUF2157 domain-containing protein [Prolixibacteraceae bacterium]
MITTKQLKELIEAEVIDDVTAMKITAFYKEKSGGANRRLAVIFSILGALLIGLGVIEIIAHNWDSFSRLTKGIFSMSPLIIGQFICGITLFQKKKLSIWHEAAASFLVMAIGASISLISQTYHMDGEMSSFMISWIIPILPVIYLMRSSMATAFYVIGAAIYAGSLGPKSDPLLFLLSYGGLLLPMLPYYISLIKRAPSGAMTTLLHWVVVLTTSLVVLTAFKDAEVVWIVPLYLSVFITLYLIGIGGFAKTLSAKYSAYSMVGSLGALSVLFTLSNDHYWRKLSSASFSLSDMIMQPSIWCTIVCVVVSAVLLYRVIKLQKRRWSLSPLVYSILLYIPVFLISVYLPVGKLFTNILLLFIGIYYILDGYKKNLWQSTNLGLLILFVWTQFRLFDMKMDFVVKGILFILLGGCFIGANIWILMRKRVK